AQTDQARPGRPLSRDARLTVGSRMVPFRRARRDRSPLGYRSSLAAQVRLERDRHARGDGGRGDDGLPHRVRRGLACAAVGAAYRRPARGRVSRGAMAPGGRAQSDRPARPGGRSERRADQFGRQGARLVCPDRACGDRPL
ncbi:MAG: hypothetical protein AVDCRST_MAG18-4672, partial [uncultured Thermomicrobiales bacterium]